MSKFNLRGKLTVTVVSARGLSVKELLTKMDPYATVKLSNSKDQEFKTKTAVDQHQTPVWNQSYIFNLEGQEELLHAVVWNKCALSDDHIGRLDLSLDAIDMSGKPAWYGIKDKNNFSKQTGEISLVVTFEGSGLPQGSNAFNTHMARTQGASPAAGAGVAMQSPTQSPMSVNTPVSPQPVYSPMQQAQPMQQPYQPPFQPQFVQQQAASPQYLQQPQQPVYQQAQPIVYQQQQPVYQQPPPQMYVQQPQVIVQQQAPMYAAASTPSNQQSSQGLRGEYNVRTFHGKYFCARPDGSLGCDAQAAKEWEKFRIDNTSSGVTLRGAHGNHVCVEGAVNVVANRAQAGAWESFDLVMVSGQQNHNEFRAALRSKHTNKFLCALPTNTFEANRDNHGDWETFTFQRVGGGGSSSSSSGMTSAGAPPSVRGNYQLRSSHGKYLSSQPDGSLVADRGSAGHWERFEVDNIGGGSNATIKLKGAHGYVCVENESRVLANRPQAAQWESFDLVMLPDTNPYDNQFQAALRSKNTNKFLAAQPDGRLEANRDSRGEWETFTFIRTN